MSFGPKRFFSIMAVVATIAGAFGVAMVKAAGMPPQLKGKSIIVNWVSDQQRTFEGETHSVHRTTNHELTIYISGAGRTFSRLYNSTPGRGSAESAQAPGDRVASRGDNRIIHFERGSLFVDAQKEGAARRITVGFNDDYTACNARAAIGKEVGARTMHQIGMISGRRMEIHSIKLSAVSCSIRSGNVFGD